MIPQIDLTRQHAALREELLAAAARVLASGRFILGPEGKALEAEVAALCGVRHGVGVASGTDALHLSLRALDVGPGDEVITPAFSFVASASAVLHAGARPVFVDIDLETFALDPAQVERAITPRTRAVIAVHLYGHPADMDPLMEIARRRGLAVVEDAAQAIGATYAGRPVGSFGDLTCLSFYPTKNLGACGDAGMVVTDKEELAERVRRLRDHVSRPRANRGAAGAGHIVTIGSVADRVVYPGNAAYAASKFGARALHEVVRAETRGSGVRATLVSPGPTDTALWDTVRPEPGGGLPSREQMLSAGDVAGAVLFALTRPATVNVDEIRLGRA